MPTIGFNFTTTSIYYVALSGTKANPIFVSKNKINLPANTDIPQLMDWFYLQLELLMNTIAPTSISYKLGISNVSNNLVQHVYYAQGILNLLSHRRNVPATNIAGQSLVATRFGQPRGTDLYNYLDQIIGVHPPHWDSKMRDSALIALNLLP